MNSSPPFRALRPIPALALAFALAGVLTACTTTGERKEAPAPEEALPGDPVIR